GWATRSFTGIVTVSEPSGPAGSVSAEGLTTATGLHPPLSSTVRANSERVLTRLHRVTATSSSAGGRGSVMRTPRTKSSPGLVHGLCDTRKMRLDGDGGAGGPVSAWAAVSGLKTAAATATAATSRLMALTPAGR